MERKRFRKKAGLIILLVMIALNIKAQTNFRQAIIVSGGLYEFAPPFTDFVTVATFNPINNSYIVFDTIYTQAVTDVLIEDNILWVAAQDSLIRYNIDTYERTHAIKVEGLNKLAVWNNHLLVTRQWGASDGVYFRVYDKNNLTILYDLPSVNDEAFDVLVVGDTAYISVPGGWASEKGKIAMVDLQTQQLVREIEMDTIGKGMRQLFLYDNKIIALNTMGWGDNFSTIAYYDIHTNQWDYKWLDVKLGNGSSFAAAGIIDDTLYAIFNNAIGTFNLNTREIIDTVLIPFTNIIAATHINSVNNNIWTTTTDYFSYGNCIVYNLQGDSLFSFITGISPEAFAFDYRLPVNNSDNKQKYSQLLIYPNPFTDVLHFSLAPDVVKIYNTLGEKIMFKEKPGNSINLANLKNGIYFVKILYNNNEYIYKISKTN